jgi:hypothetical protein
VEDVELPNSLRAIEINLDDIPSTLGFDSKMLHSLITEVSPFHVTFNSNGVLITTWFIKGLHTVILHLGIPGEMPCSISSVYLVYSLTS